MKHVFLICILFLVAAPAQAEWGLSNVVKKEIHRTNPVNSLGTIPGPPVDAPAAQGADVSYTKVNHYPFTIHIASSKELTKAHQQIEIMRRKLEMVFVTKINLGAPGTWYRIDYGAFSNVKEAVLKLQELKTKGVVYPDAFVGPSVPYAIELGMYRTQQEAQAAANSLNAKGVFPYIVKEKDDLYRLLSGAYPDEKSAAPAMSDLMALNLQPTLKKR